MTIRFPTSSPRSGTSSASCTGQDWYPIDNHYLSIKAWNGYNCYFPMPFAHSARIEFESSDEQNYVILEVDWDRYPDQEMSEPRRFCARWRREMPTQRYGEDFLMLDADGPGQLLGFVYGVRLLDDADRWSHGGADNIYLDGEGEHPAYLRGIGGEDTFGEGYGGAPPPSRDAPLCGHALLRARRRVSGTSGT